MNAKIWFGLLFGCSALLLMFAVYAQREDATSEKPEDFPTSNGLFKIGSVITDPFSLKDYDKDGRPDPRKRYEIDLNNDGHTDLLLSDPLSSGGTGGWVHSILLKQSDGTYILADRILTKGFAVEMYGDQKKLWSYGHLSASSGNLCYSYFDHKGRYRRTPFLEIHPGDGGTEVGNGILKAIFNPKTRIYPQGEQ